MKIQNDRLVTGTHSYADKLQPLCLRYEYNENASKPNAEPNNEMIKSIFRPIESDRWVVHNVPIICTIAIVIDETCGPMYTTLTSLKITTAYVTITKDADKWTKLANVIPFNSPFNDCRLTKIKKIKILHCYIINKLMFSSDVSLTNVF